jgi:hypothetical protein
MYGSFAAVWHKILLAAKSRRFILFTILFSIFVPRESLIFAAMPRRGLTANRFIRF